MATREFPLVPRAVQEVHTAHRTIGTPIPVPESIPLLQHLRAAEPRSMGGQPPVLWDHGQGFIVGDKWGNRWIDFSSGVLVTASGHGHPKIVAAIEGMARQGLYHAYGFPTEIRAQLIDALQARLPEPLARVFLLTTGSEATECCIKLARTRGLALGGPKKSVFITFDHAFHGRTMGAQWAGGIPGLKTWLGDPDPRFVNVPFPDGFRQKDVSFDVFETTLAKLGVVPDNVCGVMSETFQGCNATLMPPAYAQALRRWCNAHKALMIFDEVQGAFGRTGKMFAFQHLDVVPDLAACGKGISGGMPLSAVLGTAELMDMYGPGEMTSTHSANPVCAAAALANLEVIQSEGLIENAARLDPVLKAGAARIAEAAKGSLGACSAVGLVAALQFAQPGTTTPSPERAWEVVKRCVERGLLLFSPVGVGGGAIKICPPLGITREALEEGLSVLETVVTETAE